MRAARTRIEDDLEQLATRVELTAGSDHQTVALLRRAAAELTRQRALLGRFQTEIADVLGNPTALEALGTTISPPPDVQHPPKPTGRCPECGGSLHETPLVRACRNQRCGWRE